MNKDIYIFMRFMGWSLVHVPDSVVLLINIKMNIVHEYYLEHPQHQSPVKPLLYFSLASSYTVFGKNNA